MNENMKEVIKKVTKKHMLPKKTNRNSLPDICELKGITDSMEWEERETVINRNNYEYTKEQYERMGIKVIEEYDDLFYCVELPEGWDIKKTGSAMWNELLDDKGRKRISFFYKSAFWDRDAFNNFVCRYSFEIIPFDNYKTDATYEERKFKPWKLYITDCGSRIKKLMEMTASTREEYFALNDKFTKIAKEYLNEYYPDWKDANAYWN